MFVFPRKGAYLDTFSQLVNLNLCVVHGLEGLHRTQENFQSKIVVCKRGGRGAAW